ncbi:four helix bundle protein [Candidatus Falkowbacteria bacterium]|nr:four helix bundle protein [Candidatus Falkowbacteria bacterium]
MKEGKFLTLNDISSYKYSFVLSNYVWMIVSKWDYFAKNSVGGQFVRSVDSISANIAEGFGRYGKKDKIKFYRYSQASIKESLDWNEKAKARGLISTKDYDHIYDKLIELTKDINCLIGFTNKKLKF